jgi:hypothetical protein
MAAEKSHQESGERYSQLFDLRGNKNITEIKNLADNGNYFCQKFFGKVLLSCDYE